MKTAVVMQHECRYGRECKWRRERRDEKGPYVEDNSTVKPINKNNFINARDIESGKTSRASGQKAFYGKTLTR